jgi:hypothetical protein
MARRTGLKTDPGEKRRIARKASNGAGFSMKAEFPSSGSHGSETGLLSTVARVWGELGVFADLSTAAGVACDERTTRWTSQGAMVAERGTKGRP